MKFSSILLIILTIFFANDNLLAKHRSHSKSRSHHIMSENAKSRPSKRAHSGNQTVAAAVYGAQQLADELNYIINQNSGSADIAVYVKSMQHGDNLYARNVNKPMTPASTMKIFTAESALLFLGGDYRFSTQLLTDAKEVKNGILQGNLYIVLSGDPTLTYFDLVELMNSLKLHQIHAISGNVYIDASAYDQSYYGPGWIWKDKGYCYAAPISASIINHNCIPFGVAPSKVSGHVAQLLTSPKFFYPQIKNSVVTVPNRHSCSIHLSSSPGSIITIDGCMTKGHSWGVSYVLNDIPEYNRQLFKSLLSQQRINVYGKVTFGNTPGALSLVGQHVSKPLRLLVNEMLKKSDNVIAGALFKKLGQVYTKSPGSWENGSIAVAQILSKHANMNPSGLRILDGSGLSPDNLASPAQMMSVLDFAYHHYSTSYEFISSLPIAGVDGTLKHRMYNISRKVRAKTGTISGVVSLAGYVVSGQKEPLAFVIMVNGNKGMNWKYKSMEDRIATVLTRYYRG